jgi:hypothetical protein
MRLYSLVLTALPLLFLTSLGHLPDGLGGEIKPTNILIFYDKTVEAHFLWPYRFRVLVVEDLAGSGGLCWKTFPNGTVAMDMDRCRPIPGARLRIIYVEMKDSEEVVVGKAGVAELSWRIFTYPRATFVVEMDAGGQVVRRVFTVESRPWTLASLISFSAMLSAMVYSFRRGMW